MPLQSSRRVPHALGFRPLLVQLVSTTGAAGGQMNPRADLGPEAAGAHTNPVVAGSHSLLHGPALEEDKRLCTGCHNQGHWIPLWALPVPLHVWPLSFLNLFCSSLQPWLPLSQSQSPARQSPGPL